MATSPPNLRQGDDMTACPSLEEHETYDRKLGRFVPKPCVDPAGHTGLHHDGDGGAWPTENQYDPADGGGTYEAWMAASRIVSRDPHG
jgi:hypothetical protein